MSKVVVGIYNPETGELKPELMDYTVLVKLEYWKERVPVEINGKEYLGVKVGKKYILHPFPLPG